MLHSTRSLRQSRSFVSIWLARTLLFSLALALAGGMLPASAAGPAALVKDINLTSARHGSLQWPSPRALATVGNRVFFVSYDSNNGAELWVSDGTSASTHLVRDIIPGQEDVFIGELTDVNGMLFFVVNINTGPTQLWKSDGTTAGTVLVASEQAFNMSRASMLTNVNGTLFFVADNSAGHHSLWKSNGTATGTIEVADAWHDGNAHPSNLTAFGNQLFLIADDSVHGRELWHSDGTTTGTTLFKDINPSGDSFNTLTPPELTVIGNTLFFIPTALGFGGLWQSDGTEAGTTRVTSATASNFGASSLVNMGGKLFFAGSRRELPPEGQPPSNEFVSGLWQSDGTPAGTKPVKDLGTGLFPFISGLYSTGTRLFFAGFDKTLWTSDGTEQGTIPISDVFVGSSGVSSVEPQYTTVGSTLFFTGQDSTGDIELWKSDGTVVGTQRVKDINPAASSKIAEPVALGNTLLFAADDGQGAALWRSDGTAAGTVLVKDTSYTANGIDDDDYGAYVGIGGKLFFAPDTDVQPVSADLWVSDGTADGTKVVKHIDNGGVDRTSLTRLNDLIYFFAGDSTSVGLWRSDGTTTGTVAIKTFDNSMLSLGLANLITANNTLFFTVTNTSGYELWRSDGTAVGTSKVVDLPQTSPSTGIFTVANGRLFFAADDSVHGVEPWVSDGTAAGTHLLKEILPAADSSQPYGFTNVDGTLFFAVRFGTGGSELWKSDGTSDGTVLLRAIAYSSDSPWQPRNLTAVGSKLFFAAFDASAGTELWVSDGTEAGTQRVKNINTQVNYAPPYSDDQGASPSSLVNDNGTLLFAADDGVHGRELWRSDGTEAGTTLVKDINPGSIGSGIGSLTQVNAAGRVLFAASDGPHGVEVWETDGTATHTMQVQDIAPGAGSSNPFAFVASGKWVYFVADDGSTGHELWALDTTYVPDSLPFKMRLPLVQR